MVNLVGQGDLDDELAALNLLLLDGGESLLLIVGVLELDEAEALGAAVALGHNVSSRGVEASEDLLETLVVDSEGQVGDEEGGSRLGARASGGSLSARRARGALSVGSTASSSGGTAGGGTTAGTTTAATEATAATGNEATVGVALSGSSAASSGGSTASGGTTTAEEAAASATSTSTGAGTATPAAETTLTTSGGRDILAVLSDLDVDLATVELLLVLKGNSLVGLSLSGELNEAVAQRAGAAGDNVGRETSMQRQGGWSHRGSPFR